MDNLNKLHEQVQRTKENSKVFVLQDSKSNVYGAPITVRTRGIFIRELQEELAKGQMIWARHPQDFSVFEIGEYDEHTGCIINYPSKNCLGLVHDFRQSVGEAN